MFRQGEEERLGYVRLGVLEQARQESAANRRHGQLELPVGGDGPGEERQKQRIPEKVGRGRQVDGRGIGPALDLSIGQLSQPLAGRHGLDQADRRGRQVLPVDPIAPQSREDEVGDPLVIGLDTQQTDRIGEGGPVLRRRVGPGEQPPIGRQQHLRPPSPRRGAGERARNGRIVREACRRGI